MKKLNIIFIICMMSYFHPSIIFPEPAKQASPVKQAMPASPGKKISSAKPAPVKAKQKTSTIKEEEEPEEKDEPAETPEPEVEKAEPEEPSDEVAPAELTKQATPTQQAAPAKQLSPAKGKTTEAVEEEEKDESIEPEESGEPEKTTKGPKVDIKKSEIAADDGLEVEQLEPEEKDEQPAPEPKEPTDADLGGEKIKEQKGVKIADQMAVDKLPASGKSIAGLPVEGILKNPMLMNFIKGFVGDLFAKTPFANAFNNAVADFQRGVIRIPLIGVLKFTKEETKFVGKLYDTSETILKALSIGPIGVKNLQIDIPMAKPIPTLLCNVVFFQKVGVLKTEGAGLGVKSILSFEKPLQIPVGIKKRAPIDKFELIISKDKRMLTTETRLFGTKTEPISKVTLNLAKWPFVLKVTSKDIPITAVSGFLRRTPLRDTILTKLNSEIILIPPSIKLVGTADISSAAKLGLKADNPTADMFAKLGTRGLNFMFTLRGLKIPFGKIDVAQLTIGTAEKDEGEGEEEESPDVVSSGESEESGTDEEK